MGRNAHSRFETALYSDAEFTGYEVLAGPYTFMNTLAHVGDGGGPTIVVRTDWYLEWDLDPAVRSTDESRYVGGTAADELAALLSLCTGARIRAGGTVREWRGDDPLGRPVEYDRQPHVPFSSPGQQIVPSVSGKPKPRVFCHAACQLRRVVTPRCGPSCARSALVWQRALGISV